MSFYEPPDLSASDVQNAESPTEILLAETLGTGPAPWRRVETTLMSTSAAMRQAYDACFTPLKLNLTQASMLAQIVEFGPITQSKIANNLGHGRAATGTTVEFLEKRGYVERTTDPDDKRVKLVQVTDAGLEMAENIRELDLYISKELRRGISRTERREFAATLKRLERNLVDLTEAYQAGASPETSQQESQTPASGPSAA